MHGMTATGVPLDVRFALFRRVCRSASQAYSATFQAGLDHFGDERGFLAYKKIWGTALILSIRSRRAKIWKT